MKKTIIIEDLRELIDNVFCSKCGTKMNSMDGSKMTPTSDGEMIDLELDSYTFVCPKCHRSFHMPEKFQMINVEDVSWGIDRRNGGKSEHSNGYFYIPLVDDLSFEFGFQKIRLTVVKVNEKSVMMKITPRNTDCKPIEFEMGERNKKYIYRPWSFDGGHYYIFNYKVRDYK